MFSVTSRRQSRLSAVSAAAKSAGTAAAAAVAARTGMFRFYLDTGNMTGDKLVLSCPILYLSGWDVNPCRRFRFKAVVRMNNAHGNQCNHQPYQKADAKCNQSLFSGCICRLAVRPNNLIRCIVQIQILVILVIINIIMLWTALFIVGL